MELLHLLDPAERTSGRHARLFRCQASTLVVGSEQLQMRADLFVEPLVGATRPGRASQAPQDGAHHDPSSSRRDIIATVRDHRSASTASCFFPALVIE